MTPEAKDALTRLKAAVEGKVPVHAWTKGVLKVSTVEVNPRDVIDLCKSLPPHVKTQSLQSGSTNAVEDFLEIRTVGLHTVDVLHLIREAESLPAAASSPPPVASPPPEILQEHTPPSSPAAASPAVPAPAAAPLPALSTAPPVSNL